MTRALVVWCALWALSACNVASVQEQASAIPLNRCTSDSDCAFGSCDGKYCRTTAGSFGTILFEIAPPADATSIAGVQFIKRVDHVLEQDGALPLQLDLPAQISGVVTTSPGMCTPQFLDNMGHTYATANNDRSIPALITVSPSSGSLGLFSSPVAVNAAFTPSNMASYTFNLNVPQGAYDIYIQPPPQPSADCPMPPQLLRGHKFDGTVTLDIALPVPQTFEFHVSWPPADGALDRWTVDMLDPISGRAISNRVGLARGNKNTDYVANLSYLPVVGDTAKVDQFVRLSPPDDVPAPTVLFARSGLGLFSASSGTVNQFIALPVPVHIAGAVTAGVSPDRVAATVTLVATKVTGIDPGIVASFVRTVSVDRSGTFELDVLPGIYRVSAVPSDTASPSTATFAEASVEWQIGAEPSVQAGKVIELSDKLLINGAAVDPSGATKMTGAPVQAVASPASIVTDVLHQALGEAAYVPRAAGATVDNGGNFTLKVDTGTYDFSVRPRSSSGYAWLVIPSLPVGTTPAMSAGPGLNTLTLPLPVVYRGSLTVPGATVDAPISVPGALIDAYIYMNRGVYTTDPTQADSVLQIAETRSDEFGAFELLIPAALNTVPN